MAAALLLGVAGLLSRPYWFAPADGYGPRNGVELPVPVMTMSEYDAVISAHRRPYVFELPSASGSLHCFGVSQHTSDPANQDISRIRTEFETFRPTVALVESRMGYYVGGFDAGVRMFGESGAVYALARQAGVPLYTLELPLADEVAGVLKHHPPDQVALFYVLRPYFGERAKGPVANAEGFLAEYIRKRGRLPGLEGTIDRLDDIDRIWKRDFPGQPDWRDCDARYGLPGYLNDMAATANAVRNDHWVQVIAELVGSGQRVFMTCGCSHAVRLEPALRALFPPAGP